MSTNAIRDWRDAMPQEDWETIARQIAEHIVKRAIGGHFGFFKLVLDMVDGPVVRKAEDDLTTPADCTVILLEAERTPEMVKAA